MTMVLPGASDDVEHVTLRLSGAITLALPAGPVRLTEAVLRRDGAHGADDAPFCLTLGGTFGELRKLRGAGRGIAEMLAHAAEAPDSQEGELVLRARPDLRAELARAEREAGEVSTLDALVESDAWMSIAFAIDRYDAESVSVITLRERSTGPS